MPSASDLLDTLKSAAEEWFTAEKKRLNAEYSFLDAIAKKRGGTAGLQDVNSQGASKILVDSISQYLDKPLSPGAGG